MKLAKKTLSVALAAVMAASSLAGTVSAFAAGPTFLPKSDPVYKAISVGTTTVTANPKTDTKFAMKKADVTDDASQLLNIKAQTDETTMYNYFSFTPKKTGTYDFSIQSAPVYAGYSETLYRQLLDKGYKAEDAIEGAWMYSDKYQGLTSDKAFAKPLEKNENIDLATIENVEGKDELFTGKTTDKYDESQSTSTIRSWKYDEKTKKVVVDKKDGDEKTYSSPSYADLKDTYLVAGKTYFFRVATANLDDLKGWKTILETEEDKRADNFTYVNVKKSTAKPSVKLTISQQTDGVGYHKSYWTSDSTNTERYNKDIKPQKVTVPAGYVGKGYTGEGEAEALKFNGEKCTINKDNNYVPYVERHINVPYVGAYATGATISATIKDTEFGANVVSFANGTKALQTLTLGKNVKTVSGCDETNAPNLTKVVINNPNFEVTSAMFSTKNVTITAPSNSVAYLTAIKEGFKVNMTCQHKWVVTKAATIFATGTKKCSECDAVATVAKVRFAPKAKASKKKIVVKGNAGKVAKLAVWVYDSKGNLVKKQVKKNVTKNTVKVAKAGKYTVKVKAYGPNGAKTASVKKTVKVK